MCKIPKTTPSKDKYRIPRHLPQCSLVKLGQCFLKNQHVLQFYTMLIMDICHEMIVLIIEIQYYQDSPKSWKSKLNHDNNWKLSWSFQLHLFWRHQWLLFQSQGCCWLSRSRHPGRTEHMMILMMIIMILMMIMMILMMIIMMIIMIMMIMNSASLINDNARQSLFYFIFKMMMPDQPLCTSTSWLI